MVTEVEAEDVLEAKVMAEEEMVDLEAEAWKVKVEEASWKAEEEGQASSYKERRQTLNSFFHSQSFPLHFKERILGFLLCHLFNEPSKGIPRQYRAMWSTWIYIDETSRENSISFDWIVI